MKQEAPDNAQGHRLAFTLLCLLFLVASLAGIAGQMRHR
jgi:hypothetical protein